MNMKDKLTVHGGGMMASAIRVTANLVGAVFAAGVSNSGETDDLKYAREQNDLRSFIEHNRDNRIIYFSSYVARDGRSLYAQHKRQMEALIAETANDFIVLRLPQVVGKTSNKTLISYLVNALKTKEQIAIHKDAYRSLVDVTDVGRILASFVGRNVTREVIAVGPLKPLWIVDIVKNIESILQAKINFSLISGGERQSGDLSRALELLEPCDPLFRESYQYSVLEKYVPKLFGGCFD